ncbi:MAG: CopD family protein [Solirubrobacterales bacterium]
MGTPIASGARRTVTLRLAGLALFASAVALGVAAPDAQGHAAFLESAPEAGASLGGSPKELRLEFTEPLNGDLTEVRLVDAETGEQVDAASEVEGREEVVLRPASELPRGGYRVDWYTVSTLDGHPLEGAFGFGVRAPAPSGSESIEQSPLAREGWLRILSRAVLYAALLFFAGGIMGAALLSRGRGPAEWLYPAALAADGEGRDPVAVRERAWRNTLRAGWLASAAAAAVAVVETYDAAGGLGPAQVGDYLLANTAGLARLLTVASLLAAVALARRARDAAGGAIAIALLSIAFSGHANSAEPRALAVSTDWIHLVAGAVWVGGIAQVAAAWVPLVRRVGASTRRGAMRAVLRRFGRVALPAFVLVAASGLTNALVQLGEVPALWETAYGRVLAVKVALVGAIALASYGHAIRLRPRLIAANPHPGAARERRHWRLLSAEPVIGVAVVLAAAALVVFPLPPRQLAETEAEAPEAACEPCPVPEPKPGELTVAEAAGSQIAALWVRADGRATARVYDIQGTPAEVPMSVAGTEVGAACGAGCRRVRLRAGAEEATLAVAEGGRRSRARVPVRWDPSRTKEARQLVARAQQEMRGLAMVRIRERTSSGPGLVNTTRPVLRAPRDRTLMRANFRWGAFGATARWLGGGRIDGRPVVWVALVDRGTPIWYRLAIEPRSARVLRERLVTTAHFIDHDYSGFIER